MSAFGSPQEDGSFALEGGGGVVYVRRCIERWMGRESVDSIFEDCPIVTGSLRVGVVDLQESFQPDENREMIGKEFVVDRGLGSEGSVSS